MVREQLISSAVSFLQDPSVISSTLDQRIAFLRSKNLTQEEIDISLARANNGGSSIPITRVGQQNYAAFPNRQPMTQPPGYDYGQWGPPPILPRRDWRDWFIMATVTSGVSYGLYTIAKRYIFPLISPPTPPQLASDKASIDESFSRAFALIDQLAADTAELKFSEAQRTEKLDSTHQDVETVIADLKAANLRREAESRTLVDQVEGLKELVPKALDGWKKTEDSRLEDLAAEMRSLKKLIGNRVGGGPGPQPQVLGRSYYSGFATNDKSSSGGSSDITAVGRNEAGDLPDEVTDTPAPRAPGMTAPKQENSTGRPNRSAIPAWQLGPQADGKSTKDESGTEMNAV